MHFSRLHRDFLVDIYRNSFRHFFGCFFLLFLQDFFPEILLGKPSEILLIISLGILSEHLQGFLSGLFPWFLLGSFQASKAWVPDELALGRNNSLIQKKRIDKSFPPGCSQGFLYNPLRNIFWDTFRDSSRDFSTDTFRKSSRDSFWVSSRDFSRDFFRSFFRNSLRNFSRDSCRYNC